jgi:transmembrane sensor
MIANTPETEQRDLEAADWFARLSRTPIETEELTRFQRWSRDPANLAAYNEIEDISRAVRDLRDDPALRAAAKDALARSPERPRRAVAADWRVWSAGLALAGTIGAAVVVLKPFTAETYSTRIGEISSLRLDDGTQVRLNTDSKLRVRFSGGLRRVELVRGQAYFEVAHDTARPFVVAAGLADVRAVGTQFDVRRTGEEVRVVLAQGRVAVTGRQAGKDSWTLAPGQGLVLGGASAAPSPIPVDVAAATSWRTGTLTFHGATLAETVEELNRYSKTKIVLEDSAPRGQVVNGAFQAGDVAEFVSAATLLFGLKATPLENGDIALSAKAAPT